MASDKIKLVQGDTRPQLILSLTDDASGQPIDISAATVRMKFTQADSKDIIATMTATALTGIVLEDGSVSTASPYDVAGKGGRCVINWTPNALAGAAGDYEGEIEITFADTTVQTVYELLKFKLREQK
ncbi:hypothetical protein UFOVP33_73 [uncultured Caudovirales phage]|uniref:BppU N-terminal domain-containing protein n=1 Tax=uncultured Caudovirales phage TaxID=2100421 RepID=A0A6J5KNH2_9CAUD|nr:hypothetical protein UFOVP33_73 [uncultured Caudovirales phage]